MYGFLTRRLAEAITRLTRVGADAGARACPLTTIASSGGGAAGTKVAPPVLDASAQAPGTATIAIAIAHANARSSRRCPMTGGDILFRPPAGLADGLALKELARLSKKERFAPVT